MKSIIAVLCTLFLTNTAIASSGELVTFVSPDGELVVEVHGDAGSEVDKFFQDVDQRLSKTILRAGLIERVRKGIRVGLRKGIRKGTSVTTRKAIPTGMRAGVRNGIKYGDRKSAIRKGVSTTRRVMRKDRKEAIRKGTRVGIRSVMERMMRNGDRKGNSIVYRFVFKGVEAPTSYPHTGKAKVSVTSSNSLRIDFQEGTSEVLKSVKHLKEKNAKVECYNRNDCSLFFSL